MRRQVLPRISVITPSFNQAEYLEQTIQSVLDQRYVNLEYIIIDGGSTDRSVEVIRKYERAISYWISEKDRGQANALNKGLMKASGDLICYINSDDYYLDGALARVGEAFCSNPEIDLWHGRCRVVDQNGRKVDERIGAITRYDEILDLWDVWWQRRNFVQPEVFWTRRIAEKVGAFREDLYWVMDYEYWLRVLRAGGKVGYINTELSAFRLQPKQKSVQPERTAEELLNVVEPYIFSNDDLLGRRKRLQLQGKWLYHAKLLKELENSVSHNEPKWRRLSRIAWFSMVHPRVMAAGDFWKRALSSLTLGRKVLN